MSGYIARVSTQFPSPTQRVLRGLTLRCPDCGAGGVLASWFRLRPACRHCGLLLDRGSNDYFVGAYLINLIIAELLFAIGAGLWFWRAWPDIPWDTIQWVAAALMIVSPMVTFPFTKTTWLAVDLVFDPPTASDRVS